MIKKFEEFALNESDKEWNEIDAREDISKRSDLVVSTEVDPAHKVHPTISVYFPDLFMYIDLDKISSNDYDKLSLSTETKIREIVQDLDNSLDYELRRCIENMQKKLQEAATKIHQLPGVISKRYGL